MRMKGDIYIGGEGLARGYWKKPELDAEKFIPSPFDPTQKLYNTGDIGRWLANGDLSFEGRSDDQVKIRGYRIELGEIEGALQEIEHVAVCAISVIERDSGSELVAYLVSEHTFNINELRGELSLGLPDYMIPSYFAQLEEMPLTASGKVDYQNLPSPEAFAMKTGREFVAAENEIEKALVALWSLVLGRDADAIGTHDNFFELGGNSIGAIQMTGKINRQFDLNLPWASIFQNPTVQNMAKTIAESPEGGADPTPSGMMQLQRLGDGAPLFLVAGTGGFVMGFFALVQELGASCPVYGLEPPGIHGGEAPLMSVEALAARYIRSIREVQPSGPYRLLGHSFGAFVVFEMTKQLLAVGERVSELILLDTGIPSEEDLADREDSEAELKLGLLHTLQRYFEWELSITDEEFVALTDEEQHHFVHENLNKENVEMTLEQAAGYVDVFVSQGAIDYRPSGFVEDTQIILFKTTEMDPFIADGMAPSLGWETTSSKAPHVYDVTGNHITLLHQENVKSVTKHLKGYFDESTATIDEHPAPMAL
jgi:thioesterase domain-containing protein/acyl carrier protein